MSPWGFLGKDNRDGFQQLFSELGIANRFRCSGPYPYQRQTDGEKTGSDRSEFLALK